MPTEIEILKNALRREKEARQLSEKILEEKSLELFQAQKELQNLYEERTEELKRSIEQESKTRAEKEYVDLRFLLLIESMSDIFFTVDQGGYFTYINYQAIKLTGYTKDEIIGSHFTKFVPQEFKGKLINMYLEQGQQMEGSSYVEFPILKKDGSMIWLGQKVSLVKHRNHFEFVAISRNISEEKSARDLLKQSEEKFRSIIEEMELGILELDNDDSIVEASPQFCEMTQYNATELLGKNVKFLFSRNKKQIEFNGAELTAFIEQGTGTTELELKSKDGKSIWGLVCVTAVLDEYGEKRGSILVHMDITDRKNYETELKKAKKIAEEVAKQRELFVANVSHELRTPLNAILGMVDQIKLPESKEKEKLTVIETASHQLSQLISDILTFSKIDPVNTHLNLKASSLVELSQNLIRELEIVNQKKELKLIFETNINFANKFQIDEVKIYQILNNLLSNALKFTEKGEVKLIVTKNDSLENLVSFRVEDSGIGIEQEHLEDIFKPFVQLGNAISLEESGAGLGLAITQKMIALMEGELKVESQKGFGTTFFFDLKLESVSDFALEEKEQIELITDFKGISILVVEDNLLNQKVIKGLLESWNIQVDIAGNGLEALDNLKNKDDYAVMLVDLKMPEMNGYELASTLKNQECKIPILGLTASSFLEEDIEENFKDFDYVLSKPINKELLNNWIQKYDNGE